MRLLRRRAEYPAAMVEEARNHPNGWVYEIVGDYGPNDAVPPEAIKGAWAVDAEGKLTGAIQPNPRFNSPQS